jgi:hypothetical protein
MVIGTTLRPTTGLDRWVSCGSPQQRDLYTRKNNMTDLHRIKNDGRI